MKIEGRCWKFRFWRLPHIPNLELFYGRDVTYHYPLHIHEDHALAIILQGYDVTHHCGSTYTAQCGDVTFIHAGEVHVSESIGTEYRILNIHPHLLNTIAAEVGAVHFFPRISNDRFLYRSILNLHLKLEQNLSPLEHESEFYSTIGRLLMKQNPGVQNESKESVQLVRDYLQSHYAENVTLDHLTAITNLSPYYLIRIFRQHVGVPPHEYQTQLRVSRAKQLLRKGNPISEVALETGFFDQSHFSRKFKRIVGVSPGQYLLQGKNVQDTAPLLL